MVGTDEPAVGQDGGAQQRAPKKETAGEGGLSPAARQHNEELKQIPGGAFYMGTPKHLVHFPMDGEGPVRQVKVSSFAIDNYEVSNAKFAEFVEEQVRHVLGRCGRPGLCACAVPELLRWAGRALARPGHACCCRLGIDRSTPPRRRSSATRSWRSCGSPRR
jgi:formylglycine-generating enzyme required for sulfatase activity